MKNSILLFVIAILFISCGDDTKKPTSDIKDNIIEEFADVSSSSSFNLPINFSPNVPQNLDLSASDTLLVKFAWEEFIALNWKSTYKADGKRDNPDTSWDWTKGDPDLAVWETYAHRTELRPYGSDPSKSYMQPFDNPPHYSFMNMPGPGANNPDFTLFHNLDENNEIGSCDLYAHQNIYDETNMVLYQAKVNQEEYNYVLNNYPSVNQLATARSSKLINLPAGGNADPSGGTYDGAIEMKTAWRLLVKEDDPSKFFTRTAIYYTETNGKIVYNNKTFALIGMHIIHKTKDRPSFVFATWEHVNVENDNMAFVELKDEVETGPIHPNYKRLHPIPDIVKQANKSVHAQIKAKNNNSIWQNYRLIGVQGKPSSDQSSFGYFLANYVIESDSTLANFHGSGIGTPFDNGNNVVLNGQNYNMGGCMGCHGVAQRSGQDFSFLLGKALPAQKPDILDNLPTNDLDKLKKYISEYKIPAYE